MKNKPDMTLHLFMGLGQTDDTENVKFLFLLKLRDETIRLIRYENDIEQKKKMRTLIDSCNIGIKEIVYDFINDIQP